MTLLMNDGRYKYMGYANMRLRHKLRIIQIVTYNDILVKIFFFCLFFIWIVNDFIYDGRE
jgi:hypothetical protein